MDTKSPDYKSTDNNNYSSCKMYGDFINLKYNNSEKIYNKIYTNESKNIFLRDFEMLNIYPTYPYPIIFPLKKSEDVFSIKFDKNKSTVDLIDNDLNKKLYDAIVNFKKCCNVNLKTDPDKPHARKFFDYEIRDTIQENIQSKHKITNAWVKMYEMLMTFDLFKRDDETITAFHLCEHPGKFIFAIKEYLKRNDYKYDFTWQSLKPTSNNKKIFPPDNYLYKKYKNKLDYGPDGGNITSKKNIDHYAKKYRGVKYHLITSDCGMDYSEDFTKQELGLYNVFKSAFITAIKLSSPGTHYIFKMFSFNDIKTINFLQIVCMFYEKVDIVKTMTTRTSSGEIYCICQNFNFEGDVNKIVDEVLYVDKKVYLYSKFIERIHTSHKILTKRRILAIRFLIFRFKNYNYIYSKKDTKNLIKNYVNYYVDYFIKYTELYKKYKKEVSINKYTKILNYHLKEPFYINKKYDLLYFKKRYMNPSIYISLTDEKQYITISSNQIQHGGGYKKFIKLFDNNYYRDKIVRIEAAIDKNYGPLMYNLFYENIINIKFATLEHMISKYKIIDPEILIFTNFYNFNKYLKYYKSYVNKIPNGKMKNIVIFDMVKFTFIRNNIKSTLNAYIEIINNNLENNGNLVIYTTFLINNENFYKFIEKIVSSFKNVYIHYPIIPINMSYQVYIICMNKSDKELKKKNIHYNLSHISHKINKHLVEEYKLISHVFKLLQYELFNILKSNIISSIPKEYKHFEKFIN